MPIRRRPRLKIALPQQKIIKVELGFYNDEEHEKLKSFPSITALEELVSQTTEIPIEEFLTYYLLHRRRHNPEAYANYAAVRGQIQQAAAALENMVEISDESIRVPPAVDVPINEVSEHIGEAIGLSVVSRVHGLTEADWIPIPQQHGRGASPTFDFSLASDGTDFVELEAKGSSVDDNRTISATIRNHAANIRGKKEKLAKSSSQSAAGGSRGLRYGTITAVDRRTKGHVRCWIMDPPFDEQRRNPRVFRLIRRLYFMRNWIGLVAPRSQLAAALASRLAAVERIADPFELNALPLLRGDGEPFAFDKSAPHLSFFNSRSRVEDVPAGGLVDRLTDESLLFLGIHENLLRLATVQDFDEILMYRERSMTMETTVECVVPEGRMRTLPISANVQASATRRGGYYVFRLRGRIYVSPGGVIFGQLYVEPEREPR